MAIAAPLRTMAASVLLLLLLAVLASRTDCTPAPEPPKSWVFPSPAAPSPGVSEAIIKRTALSCKGACGSYACV